MSIDGPGLLESDLAHDVYQQIMDQWDAGVAIDEIRRRLGPLDEFAREPIDAESFLAAALKAFWEIGEAHADLRDRLQATIAAGSGLAQWAESSDALARRRRSTLERLLAQTAAPNAKPRPRRQYAPVKNKLFAVGDCLELVTGSRTWHALVCKIGDKRGRCEYFVAPMRSVRRSTQRAFEDGKVFAHWIGTPADDIVGVHVARLEHRALLRDGNPFTTVARVELDPALYMLGSFGAYTEIKDIEAHFEWIEQRSKGPTSLQRWPIPLIHMLRADC